MFSRKSIALALTAGFALSGCATGSSGPVAAGDIRPIPKLSQPDNGLQLNMNSGAAMYRSTVAMLKDLKRSEASVVATAMIVLTNYEGCKKSGYLTLRKATDNDGPKNLTPEQCYDMRNKMQMASFSSRDHVLKWGRPTDDLYYKHRYILTGRIDEGGRSAGDSWDSVIGYSDGALHGMTRTELLTEYHKLMGKKVMKPLPGWIEAIN